MAKRLRYGKGIKVRSAYFDGVGEIVRLWISDINGPREYEIRLGPAHFIYLQRKDFDLVDSIIKFDALVKLRQTGLY